LKNYLKKSTDYDQNLENVSIIKKDPRPRNSETNYIIIIANSITPNVNNIAGQICYYEDGKLSR